MKIVTAETPAQVLSLIPQVLGVRPHDSLVLVPFNEAGRTIGAARFDLPSPDDESRLAQMSADLILRTPAAVSMLVITYGDSPNDELVEQIASRAHMHGLGIIGRYHVAGTRYGSYDSDESGDVDANEDVPAHDALPEPEPEPAIADAYGGQDILAIMGDSVTIAEAIAGVRSPSPELIARWARLLSKPSTRDIALITVAGGEVVGTAAFAAQLAWESGGEFPVSLARILWGEGAIPKPERLCNALGATERALASLSEDTAHFAASAGWLSWALGRSTQAEKYAERALGVDPEHGLADIVRSFVLASHLPGWAFKERY